MNSRKFTKSFSQILTHTFLSQHGLPNQKCNNAKYFISTSRLYNSDLLRSRKIKQSVLVDFCYPKLICSRSTSLTTTSKVNYSILSNMISPEPSALVPVKLFTHKVDIEPMVYNGTGWAGQPIVKRIHPILPEVYGNITDISNNHDYQKSISFNSEVDTNAISPEPKKDLDALLTLESMNKEHKEAVLPNKELVELKGESIIHNDMLSTKITKGQEILTNNIIKIHNAFLSNKIKHSTNKISSSDIQKDKEVFKQEDGHLNQNKVYKKKKSKKRRKTKVCDVKTNAKLNAGKLKPLKKKEKLKENPVEKRYKIDHSPLLNHRTSTHAVSKKALNMGNRQFSTCVTSYYPRVSKVAEKPPRLSKLAEEDCTCPEVYVNKGKRRKTRICGKAAGAEEKKEKKVWKPKMCLLDDNNDNNRTKYRNKTFVCTSKAFEKDKKKKKLPKCVKPEIKVVPRVQICSSILIDELERKSKKKCEKPVEEEKIRKITTICKPVIQYAKEISQVKVKVEKAACVTVKKNKSRHTNICPPESDVVSNKLRLIQKL